jgi:hypothetical protein
MVKVAETRTFQIFLSLLKLSLLLNSLQLAKTLLRLYKRDNRSQMRIIKVILYNLFFKNIFVIVSLIHTDENSHVVVHALALDFDTDTRLKDKYPERKTLTINNKESFYNYKTIGDQFQLATSVLSELDLVKMIDKSKSDTRPNESIIVEELPLSDSSVHFNTILAKKQRMNAALLQIKRNITERNVFNDNFFNFFSSHIEPEEENVVVRDKPLYCRDVLEITATKKPCIECESVCSYLMDDILDLKNGINQNDIIAELAAHHHPKSR